MDPVDLWHAQELHGKGHTPFLFREIRDKCQPKFRSTFSLGSVITTWNDKLVLAVTSSSLRPCKEPKAETRESKQEAIKDAFHMIRNASLFTQHSAGHLIEVELSGGQIGSATPMTQ
jgi:hypothetical protein